jgi:hypothetical protein
MNVQDYLRSGKTLENLTSELAISVTKHDSLPLVILNYDQIDSPKTNPIVRECRGLVLQSENYSLVARAFGRFFNWGEVADEMPLFDWNTCIADEKADGSLVLIYNFEGQWLANTRGSFAGWPIFNDEYKAKYFGVDPSMRWSDAFLKALNVNSLDELNLDPSITYVCEFCSLWNKVVREYPTPCMYLLTRFAGEQEIGPLTHPAFRTLQRFPLTNVQEVQNFCTDHPEATFEGVVVKDSSYRRWKLKNPRYVSLHHMKGNGDGMWRPKYMLPYILKNEGDELLTYFPEITELYNEYRDKVNAEYVMLEALWLKNKDIVNQKEFALSIVGKTPFTGVLFNLRRDGGDLKRSWLNHEDGILKVLFKA